MITGKKSLIKCIIFLIVLLFSALPISYVVISLQKFNSFSSIFINYINSGKSIFIPVLPKINILWFLPDSERITRFSMGHLIDLIIICNLVCFIDRILYQYYLSFIDKEQKREPYLGLYNLGININVNKENIDEDFSYELSDGYKSNLSYLFPDNVWNFKYKKNNWLSSKKSIKVKENRKFLLTFYKSLIFLPYLSHIKKSFYDYLINSYLFLIIIYTKDKDNIRQENNKDFFYINSKNLLIKFPKFTVFYLFCMNQSTFICKCHIKNTILKSIKRGE